MGCGSSRSNQQSIVEKIVTDNARDLYDIIDEDKNGRLDCREVDALLHKLGIHPSRRQLADFINSHDLDGDGLISYEEFKLFLLESVKGRSQDLVALFQFLDINNDGKISYEEFNTGMKFVGRKGIRMKAIQVAIEEYHSNNIGEEMNLEQFCRLFLAFV